MIFWITDMNKISVSKDIHFISKKTNTRFIYEKHWSWVCWCLFTSSIYKLTYLCLMPVLGLWQTNTNTKQTNNHWLWNYLGLLHFCVQDSLEIGREKYHQLVKFLKDSVHLPNTRWFQIYKMGHKWNNLLWFDNIILCFV